MWKWADARRGAVRVVLLTISWTFTVLGDPNGYIYVPPPTQPPPQYGYSKLCITNEQCDPNECCKPATLGYFACSPIGYDPRQCIQYSSPVNTKCNKDADCQYGGCCVMETYGWGSCRYDPVSCKKDEGPKKCSSSKECGFNGCCAWDPYLGNNFCLGGSARASKRAIIFPQTKYPPYPPPSPTKYPPYITPPPPTKYPLPPGPYPYPTKYPPPMPYPAPTKYPVYPPYPPSPTKYPVYPPYPPPPTKYPVYPPYPQPPTKYPPYPTYPTYPPYPPQTKYPVYPPYPPPSPTKYPTYPPYPPPYPYPPPPSPTKYPAPTKYPPYQTATPQFCLP